MSELFACYPDILSIVDVTEMLNISRSSVYRLIRGGELKVLSIGAKYIVPKKNLIEYVNSAHFVNKKNEVTK